MTNEEAINILELHNPFLGGDDYKLLSEAMDMAIDALKAQLSGENATFDCISRQAAIRIVDGIDTWQAGWRGDAIESVKALPPVQPEKCTEERTETHAVRLDVIDRYPYYQQALTAVSKLPSAQPEIIRCRDCKEFRRWIDTDITFCDCTESEVKEDDFCSRAERRTDG